MSVVTFAWSNCGPTWLHDNNMYATMKAAGIDVVMDYQCSSNVNPGVPSNGLVSLITHLDDCYANELKVLVNMFPDTYMPWWTVTPSGPNMTTDLTHALAEITKTVNAVKGHPALFGYHMFEEFYADSAHSGWPPNISNTFRQACYDLAKDLDPYHPVEEGNNHFDTVNYTTSTHDMFGVDHYCYFTADSGLTENQKLANHQAWYADFSLHSSPGDKLIPFIQTFSATNYSTPPVGSVQRQYDSIVASGIPMYGLACFIWKSGHWETQGHDAVTTGNGYLASEISTLFNSIHTDLYADEPAQNALTPIPSCLI